jgi:hypothetical protein
MLGFLLGACGLYVPDKNPLSDDQPDQQSIPHSSEGDYENKIVSHVACEIGSALLEAKTKLRVPWLDAWGTAVTLTITAEDQSGLNPGVSLTTPLENSVRPFPVGGNVVSPQSFSLGLGGTGSANTTRTETIQFTYLNTDLEAQARGYLSCAKFQNGLTINGDLKIRQFIYDKMLIARLGNATTKDWRWPLYNTFTESLNFVSALGVSATPTWKFARVATNPTGTFASVLRTYTNNLVVTIGPVQTQPSSTKPAQLQSAAQTQHNNQVQANAIATSLQGQTTQ